MIGTIFDECLATNVLFSADFTRTSFRGAKLQGVHLLRSILEQTSFQQAKLALVQLREQNCREASFAEADLRFADLVKADLCGADFSGADLTEANLAAVRFDTRTRLHGTILRGATLTPALRTYAEREGAILSLDREPTFYERERAQLAATLLMLQEDNTDGHLDTTIAWLTAQLEKFKQDPTSSWAATMRQAIPPEAELELLERYSDAHKGLAYFL